MAEPSSSVAVVDRAERISDRVDREVTKSLGVLADGRGINFENALQVSEYAKLMSSARAGIPAHFRGDPGSCLAVIEDALRFGFSPFQLARKAYFVNDRVAYEAQVIYAIVLRYAPIRRRPTITYSGEGVNRRCKVVAEDNDGVLVEYESPPIKDIKVKNSPLWVSDPDQQLHYYSTRGLARRHFPDILLGLYDREELEGAGELTPPMESRAAPGLAARLPGAGKAAPAGFSREAADAQIIPPKAAATAPPNTGASNDDKRAEADGGPVHDVAVASAGGDGEQHQRTADGEQHDEAPVSGADGRGEGADDPGEGSRDGDADPAPSDRQHGPDGGDAGIEGTVAGRDESGAVGDVGGEAHHEVAAASEADLFATKVPAARPGQISSDEQAVLWGYLEHQIQAIPGLMKVKDLAAAAQRYWTNAERPAKGTAAHALIERIYTLSIYLFEDQKTEEEVRRLMTELVGPKPA